MRRIALAALIVAIVGAGALYWSLHAQESAAVPGPAAPASPPLADLKLSGPFTHQNLCIFLVHGPDTFKLTDYLTLAEAMEQNKFVIHETQDVNQLEMENLSDKSVILLSGDILKGGQQDRIAQNDQVVPPKSGKLKLACFCVEHTASRWMQKLDKENGKFQCSPGCIASNRLRLANRFYSCQGDVWSNVRGLQEQLSSNLNADVKAKESDSSLALSLEHKKVQEEIDKYSQKLADIVKDKKDVVGYVFAINGQFISADMYGSNQLFEKVWSRLLKANAIEAVAEMEKDKKYAGLTVAGCRKFMDDSERFTAEMAKANQERGSLPIYGRSERGSPAAAGQQLSEKEGKSLLFETADKQNGVLRRNILAR